MEIVEREATPEELSGWGPERPSLGARLFGGVSSIVVVLLMLGIAGVGAMLATDGGIYTVFGVGTALLALWIVGGVVRSQVDAWRGPPVPRVREITLRPTAVGFAHDGAHRDLVWCFLRTDDGVYVRAYEGDAWDPGVVLKALAHARLELHYLGSEFLLMKAGGPPVPVLGPDGPLDDDAATWTEGGQEIDIGSGEWTRVEAYPAFLR